MDLKDKLNIVQELLLFVLIDKETELYIDPDGSPISRAFDCAYNYVNLDKPITKKDLKYINGIIQTLINTLGTDWTMINKTYVSEKLLNVSRKPFIPTDAWIRAYKDLLKIIVS